ncbi:uncharacterized protein BJ171DRAFT_617303 [Polychytrium aggregatum]|uniref:uncharacterized protein n=1 Tax=Polychytrium aggregatum TaxID=110093 RepID=UPI0022FDD5F2|nr:uncharacterized protein BJ171DRAFT_617303 [Polychytrium aggregatum]KAI9190582.1 hypothetical protein BJ171DRAFT_617303 [Polychytrium aggregatum]
MPCVALGCLQASISCGWLHVQQQLVSTKAIRTHTQRLHPCFRFTHLSRRCNEALAQLDALEAETVRQSCNQYQLQIIEAHHKKLMESRGNYLRLKMQEELAARSKPLSSRYYGWQNRGWEVSRDTLSDSTSRTTAGPDERRLHDAIRSLEEHEVPLENPEVACHFFHALEEGLGCAPAVEAFRNCNPPRQRSSVLHQMQRWRTRWAQEYRALSKRPPRQVPSPTMSNTRCSAARGPSSSSSLHLHTPAQQSHSTLHHSQHDHAPNDEEVSEEAYDSDGDSDTLYSGSESGVPVEIQQLHRRRNHLRQTSSSRVARSRLGTSIQQPRERRTRPNLLRAPRPTTSQRRLEQELRERQEQEEAMLRVQFRATPVPPSSLDRRPSASKGNATIDKAVMEIGYQKTRKEQQERAKAILKLCGAVGAPGAYDGSFLRASAIVH